MVGKKKNYGRICVSPKSVNICQCVVSVIIKLTTLFTFNEMPGVCACKSVFFAPVFCCIGLKTAKLLCLYYEYNVRMENFDSNKTLTVVLFHVISARKKCQP